MTRKYISREIKRFLGHFKPFVYDLKVCILFYLSSECLKIKYSTYYEWQRSDVLEKNNGSKLQCVNQTWEYLLPALPFKLLLPTLPIIFAFS